MHTQDSPRPPRPPWLNDGVEAVRIWYTAEGGGRDRGKRGASKVGQALVAPDKGAGWFEVMAREGSFDETDLENAYLAPAEGAKRIRYNLRESVQQEGRLFVRVGQHAPAEGLYLWKQGRPAGQLLKTLQEGLEALDGSGVVSAFGRGRPDPLPSIVRSGSATTGLNDGQQSAFTACVSRGLQLIWGPPGTGKTEVIARAIEYLRAQGKSVLLVSGTNIAVDNALERAVRRIQPPPGAMIRVGTSHLAAVAENADVSLAALTQQRRKGKEEELHALEERIAEANQPVTEYEQAKERLAGFDDNAYRAARTRIETSARTDRLRSRCGGAVDAVEAAQREVDRVADAAAQADGAWREIAAAAARWERVDAIGAEIKQCEARKDRAVIDVHDARQELARAHAALAEIGQGGLLARLGSGRRRKEAEAAVSARKQSLERVQDECRAVEGAVGREIERLQAKAAEFAEANRGTSRERVEQVGAARQQAMEAAKAARRRRDTAQTELAALRAELKKALSEPQSGAQDHDLVEAAESDGLPQLFGALDGLAARAKEAGRSVEALDKQRRNVERELAELGRDAERYFVGQADVVASTLAMMRMKPVITQREYDYVIVDECAASSIPEVMYAVARAKTGAVLMGDFMQNAPIASDKLRRSTDHRVGTWLPPRDCFSFFAAATPQDASREPGCVVLTEQHRFGAELTALANEAAYGGLLRAASDRARSKIIFVDVDGLGESMAGVQKNPEAGGKGNWWSVGGIVARAVAEQQLTTGAATSVGVVTPYRVQADLTQSMIEDSGGSTRIDVGTSHRFQGREFETVVFDMVENGRGWVASGELGANSFKLAGLKLFTVAVTRAQHHLFLVGDGTAVERARSGPLAAIRSGIERGDITVARVRDVIGAPEPSTLEGAAYDLWDALSQFVKYTGIYDEGEVPDELLEHIAEAQESIWLWAPWVSTRAAEFLPALEDAKARGVDVRVVTLPRWELTRSNNTVLRFHDEVVRRIGDVVFMSDQHQKIVVIDRQTTFIGSMNLLSHKRDTGRREIMTVIESAAYAGHVLSFERVEQLSHPPLCAKCRSRMRVVKLTKPKKDPVLRWQCRTGSGKMDLCSEAEFPPLAGARNQRGPQR